MIKPGDYVMVKTTKELVLFVTEVNDDGTVEGTIEGIYEFKNNEIQID